ncbi:hypothetical protein IE4872_PC00052 (plasmid) [Rhizobium gallicum]|uniref:Uncharacterized protein n=1 Tax=Rhizobium gallicum TaxID=56730 RepID=A0A1L5NQA9_9HYPH|nr:hypothetical protein IE4872_PC00052 [Rhizobium gallicum]
MWSKSAMPDLYGPQTMDARHVRWLACQVFDHPAHHILLAEYCQAIEDAGVRLDRLTKLVVETAASWSMAPVVAAYQAMREPASARHWQLRGLDTFPPTAAL